MKIATFNLKNDHWSALKTHWSRRKPAIQEFFSIENPDIVGTQELNHRRVLELLEMKPEYAMVGEGRQGGELGEYCAIFYKKEKFQCLSNGTFWLSNHPHEKSRGWLAMFPRICTWAKFSMIGEVQQEVVILNTHLDHFSPYARSNGILQIRKFIQENFHQQATVLMGDFNAKPNSKALKLMDTINAGTGLFNGSSYSVFYSTKSPNGKTYHGFGGGVVGMPIDYIFTSKEILIDSVCVEQKKYCGMYPSDHFPIVMNCK